MRRRNTPWGMTGAMIVTFTILSTGCLVTQLRQQSVEYALNATVNAQDEIVNAAKATRAIAEALREVAAFTEERPAMPIAGIATPIRALATALSAAHSHTTECGKTLAVVQEDIGRAQSAIPGTSAEAEAMRARYRSASRMWNMAMSWVKSKIPLIGAISGGGAPGGGPSGWSSTSILGVIGTVAAAVAGLGEGARRTVKNSRRKTRDIEEAHAETEDAMKALDELKKVNPDEVKRATNGSARPLLRKAYVRREMNSASGTGGIQT